MEQRRIVKLVWISSDWNIGYVTVFMFTGAMLMAMYLQGLSDKETVYLTHALRDSGDALIWPEEWRDLLVDKHSTGGVGDKTSLPLAPAIAACGLKIPMLSGRGLEFTGGTLDKLESIPGFKVQLSQEEMTHALRHAGCFIAGHTPKLAPADRVLYSRRDVTATVDSNPLTVASIVAKKSLEGVKCLVMDIKIGRAALFKEETQARELATNFISVAERLGINTRVALTRMDVPLGHAVGNALEVAETVEYLRGAHIPDLDELVTVLAGEILKMKGHASSRGEGQKKVSEVIKSGSALRHFEKMLQCQGVSAETAHELCYGDIWAVLPHVSQECKTLLFAHRDGYVGDVDALEIARVCQELGAGRSRADKVLDLRVGVRLLLVPGDVVHKGSPWLEVHHPQTKLDAMLQERLKASLTVNDQPPAPHTARRVIELI
ncbi:hypothetical protein B566_EDAN000878 [Ephemera danica]|nr:hypothetical protein B566_EDAN000878 [Ephemera danica]